MKEDSQDAMQWRDIETAPRDGTPIQVKIPDNGDDNIIAWVWGLCDDDGKECQAWAFVSDQEPPDCWADGWCWAFNEDGNPSKHPTEWKLPPTTKALS